MGYTIYMASKDTGMRIRVERELRQEFLDVCRAQDRPAAQVLREFMREYVYQNRQAAQQDLFLKSGIELEPEK